MERPASHLGWLGSAGVVALLLTALLLPGLVAGAVALAAGYATGLRSVGRLVRAAHARVTGCDSGTPSRSAAVAYELFVYVLLSGAYVAVPTAAAALPAGAPVDGLFPATPGEQVEYVAAAATATWVGAVVAVGLLDEDGRSDLTVLSSLAAELGVFWLATATVAGWYTSGRMGIALWYRPAWVFVAAVVAVAVVSVPARAFDRLPRPGERPYVAYVAGHALVVVLVSAAVGGPAVEDAPLGLLGGVAALGAMAGLATVE